MLNFSLWWCKEAEPPGKSVSIPREGLEDGRAVELDFSEI